MAVNHKSFKDNLTAKEMTYSDDFFTLKCEPNVLNDSFTVNTYEAFKDINSIKSANYSDLFLSKKQPNSNWLETKSKKSDEQIGFISTLSFFSENPDDHYTPGAWLYFDKNYEFWDAYVNAAEYSLVKGRPDKSYTNYIFYIEFIDDSKCTISHWFGDLKFYARVTDAMNFEFTVNKDSDCEFVYNIDGNRLQLFKLVTITTEVEGEEPTVETKLYRLYCENTGSNEYTGEIEPYNGKISFEEVTDDSEENSASIIYIANNILDFDFYTSSSYIAYDRSQYIDSIDRAKSAFTLDSQMLFHHQYNTDEGINFVPLKNHITYKGNSVRGNNLSMGSRDYPDVNYRNYNAINTTKNQELGDENVTLNYIFNDQEFTVRPGDQLQFDIPTVEENGGINPLYPFKYININDTKFAKNGAFASSSPAFSDKIKKLQTTETSAYVNKCIRATANNETYLYTWLYKSENNDETPIWLDRYYYPDKITREEALKGDVHFYQSFNNVLDKNYTDEKIKNLIRQHTYIDKVSDMVIEPGNSYVYSRLSYDMILEKLDKMAEKSIETCFSNKAIGELLFDRKELEGTNFYKIDYKDFKKTNKLNINFDLYLDAKIKPGIQLFGCDYKSGFNIQNRKDLAPLHYYASESTIYLLNDNFEIVHSFNLTSKYGMPILKFILGDQFDDVIIISTTALFVLTYDLKLVSKINFTSEDVGINKEQERFITAIGSLIQYPYEDNSEGGYHPVVPFPGGISEDVTPPGGKYGDDVVFDYSTKIDGSADISLYHAGFIDKTYRDFTFEGICEEDFTVSGTVDTGVRTGEFTNVTLFIPETNEAVYNLSTPIDLSEPLFVGIGESEKDLERIPEGSESLGIIVSGFYKKYVKGKEVEVVISSGFGPVEYSTPIEKLYLPKMSINDPVGGSVEILTNLAKLLVNQNGICYNNNFYVPCGQYIIKCVFVPENDADLVCMNGKKLGIRPLADNEYYVNYLRDNLGEAEDDVLALENGFIEVENIIKHIHIDKSGTIYGLNFDKFAVSPDDDTIYGLYANSAYINSGGWYWLFNQSLSKIKSSVSSSKYAEFASSQSIDWVVCDDKDNMMLIRNFNKLEEEANDDPPRFEIYDKSKRKIYSYEMPYFIKVIAVDSYRYFNDYLNERLIFNILGVSETGAIKSIQFDSENNRMEDIETHLPAEYNQSFYQTTNTPALLRYANENKLYFNLYFPSEYIYGHKAQIVWDINDVQTGFYNLNAVIDIDKAIFEIRINDIVYEKVEENEWFIPYINSNGTMFTDSYYIGCIGKKYGTELNKILKRRYDPYCCKDTVIKNMSIYAKTLDYGEYEAMRLKEKPINELILTLPCGSRANIEEIIRYFKYSYPGSISNKVKLNISGSGFETEGEFAAVKREIESAISDNKDCLIDIKQINFVK